MQATLRRRALLAGLGPLLALACAAQAADPKPVNPDSELLEFLGSSDDVDSDLQQYLAKPDGNETQDAKPKPTPKRGSGQT